MLEKLLELDDISLLPITNRGNQAGKCNFGVLDELDKTFSLPIFTSPVDSIVNESNVKTWIDNGIRPVLPKTLDINFRLESSKYIFTAFTLKEVQDLFINSNQGNVCRRICIDEENGHDIGILNAGSTLKQIYKENINIMAGNIGNAKTYPEYCKAGIDYVRVGFNTGSLASKDYGFYSPMASLLLDVLGTRSTMIGATKYTKIIADGGIADSVDILKCIALGADYVMLGRQLVKLLEASGTIYRKDSSNADVQIEVTKEEAAQILKQHGGKDLHRIYYGEHNPGLQTSVKVTGLLSNWLGDLQNKFTYAFTLADALDWKTYKKNIKFGRVQ
jgi:hypothetical protein